MTHWRHLWESLWREDPLHTQRASRVYTTPNSALRVEISARDGRVWQVISTRPELGIGAGGTVNEVTVTGSMSPAEARQYCAALLDAADTAEGQAEWGA